MTVLIFYKQITPIWLKLSGQYQEFGTNVFHYSSHFRQEFSLNGVAGGGELYVLAGAETGPLAAQKRPLPLLGPSHRPLR